MYPAFFREGRDEEIGDTAFGEEATCFFHEEKAAEVACDRCGRLLCSLCQIRLGKELICTSCLESDEGDQSGGSLVQKRRLWGQTCLYLSILPVLCIWPTIITAPLVIFLAIRYWNAPGSLVGRSRIKFIIALIFAVLQVCVWGIVAVFQFTA